MKISCKNLRYYIIGSHWLIWNFVYGRIIGLRLRKILRNNQKIKTVKQGQAVPIISSYRIDSVERQEILEQTFLLTFKNISPNNFLIVLDASDNEQALINKQIVERNCKARIQYRFERKRFSSAYAELLGGINEDVVAIVFDDQPIIGYSDSLLLASQQLLIAFCGVVDVVLFEYPQHVSINKDKKNIEVDLESLEFKKRDIKPEAIVNYSGHYFAIIKNFHYGFFFNNSIVNRDQYLSNLSYYRASTRNDSTVEIEDLGRRKLGPVFYYLAIPLDVYMLDFDFSRSSQSVRGENSFAQELLMASKIYGIINKKQ
ncbi:MAG: hypothetical protein NT091_02575 [Candidatus Falkowbacteria bacterium]|nr:hypothetical protein [Candidatus Falkowbacteria bacterium]